MRKHSLGHGVGSDCEIEADAMPVSSALPSYRYYHPMSLICALRQATDVLRIDYLGTQNTNDGI